MSLPQAEQDRRMRLYKKGYTDKEIAVFVGKHYTTIIFWRKSNDLPANIRAEETAPPDEAVMEIRKQKWRSGNEFVTACEDGTLYTVPPARARTARGKHF